MFWVIVLLLLSQHFVFSSFLTATLLLPLCARTTSFFLSFCILECLSSLCTQCKKLMNGGPLAAQGGNPNRHFRLLPVVSFLLCSIDDNLHVTVQKTWFRPCAHKPDSEHDHNTRFLLDARVSHRDKKRDRDKWSSYGGRETNPLSSEKTTKHSNSISNSTQHTAHTKKRHTRRQIGMGMGIET